VRLVPVRVWAKLHEKAVRQLGAATCVLAYMVGQRSREISLRMALGAARADILKLVLGKGVVLAGAGATAGVILSAMAASMMASLLYGIRPHDPTIFSAVPVLLLAVALLASYLPARRATKVDPILGLREANQERLQ
jgi:putative ABC transport system permease protein